MSGITIAASNSDFTRYFSSSTQVLLRIHFRNLNKYIPSVRLTDFSVSLSLLSYSKSIPSHLVADVVEGAAKTHVKDDFGFEMICQGKFTTAQIDKNTWSEDMLDMLLEWIKTDPRGEEYRDLDWSKEYDLARNGDPNDTQTAL